MEAVVGDLAVLPLLRSIVVIQRKSMKRLDLSSALLAEGRDLHLRANQMGCWNGVRKPWDGWWDDNLWVFNANGQASSKSNWYDWYLRFKLFFLVARMRLWTTHSSEFILKLITVMKLLLLFSLKLRKTWNRRMQIDDEKASEKLPGKFPRRWW